MEIQRELNIKLDQDTKDFLRNEAASETTYKEKMKKMLDILKDRYKGNYRMLKNIDNVGPLYDIHDFWDSQPVPKAYEQIEEKDWDQPIDKVKTVAEVKQEPYTLPEGFYWADIDINNREQALEVYKLLT